MNVDWGKRRWFEFRRGHNTYLVFIPSALNTILLAFNLIIIAYFQLDNNPLYLFFFGLLVVTIYVPVAILFGHFHNKNQLATDVTIDSLANPILVGFIDSFKRVEKELDFIKVQLEALKK